MEMATQRKPSTSRMVRGTYRQRPLSRVEVTQGVRTLAHAEAEIRELMEKRKIDQETIARLALDKIELSRKCRELEGIAKLRNG